MSRRHIFTEKQEAFIRDALHNAIRDYTMGCLAHNMGLSRAALRRALRGRISAEFAIRLAHATFRSIDALLLRPGYSDVRCPTCGTVRCAS
jgi:DNA-binding phage protein